MVMRPGRGLQSWTWWLGCILHVRWGVGAAVRWSQHSKQARTAELASSDWSVIHCYVIGNSLLTGFGWQCWIDYSHLYTNPVSRPLTIIGIFVSTSYSQAIGGDKPTSHVVGSLFM